MMIGKYGASESLLGTKIIMDRLKTAFGKLKTGKLAGIDEVHAQMIKECSELGLFVAVEKV